MAPPVPDIRVFGEEYAVYVCLLEIRRHRDDTAGSTWPGVKFVTSKPGNVYNKEVVCSSPKERVINPTNGVFCAYIV